MKQITLVVIAAAAVLGVAANAQASDPGAYTYKVTDSLVAPVEHEVFALGTGDINTAFWVVSGLTAPIGFCVPTTWSIGPDGFTIHPNNGSLGVPYLWAFGGNFRITAFVALAENVRSGFSLSEYTDLSSPSVAFHIVLAVASQEGRPSRLAPCPI